MDEQGSSTVTRSECSPSLLCLRQLLNMTRALIRDGTLIQLCINTLQVLPVMLCYVYLVFDIMKCLRKTRKFFCTHGIFRHTIKLKLHYKCWNECYVLSFSLRTYLRTPSYILITEQTLHCEQMFFCSPICQEYMLCVSFSLSLSLSLSPLITVDYTYRGQSIFLSLLNTLNYNCCGQSKKFLSLFFSCLMFAFFLFN